MVNHLRYSVRMLTHRPGFSLVAILTLALGIGANTTIFTLIDSILLRPLAYDQSERILGFWGDGSWSRGELAFMREDTRSYEHLAAFGWAELTLTGGEEPLAVLGVQASANLFSVLNAHAVHGRVFRLEEEQPGKANVAILSDGLWQRAFGADPGILGQAITINGSSLEVIGVMPPDFKFPTRQAELWIPIVMDPEHGGFRGHHYLALIARLKPDATLSEAQAELPTVVPRMQKELELREGFDKLAVPPTVTTFQDQIVGKTRPRLLLLSAAVGFVLLIACANVANLLLARTASRHREIAIRSALGASRATVVSQLLVESVVLALSGGTLGLLAATWGIDLVVAALPAGSPRIDEIAVDPRALVFCVGVSLITVLLFGLAPALQTSRTDLRVSLSESGRSGNAGTSRRGARQALVVAEVALAVILVIAAGLMGRSFYRLVNVDPGFDADSLLSFRVDLASEEYAQADRRIGFYRQLTTELQSIPGVESVGGNSRLPIAQRGAYQKLAIEGVPDPPGEPWRIYWRSVAGNYFDAMKTPLVEGRGFTDLDASDSLQVCLINESMAQRFWLEGGAVGHRIQNSMDGDAWITIAGVVGDVKHDGLDQATGLMMYRPYAQSPPWISNLSMAVRSSIAPESLIPRIRGVTREIDANIPVFRIQTMDQVLDDSVSQQSLTMGLVSLFGSVSLGLAALGVFGVLSFTVSQRTREIGIRRALGARGQDVLGMVLKEGMSLVLAGLALGLLGALALTRLMTDLLFDVRSTDPSTYLAVSVLIVAVAFLACYLPGRRASRVDPMVVLRYE